MHEPGLPRFCEPARALALQVNQTGFGRLFVTTNTTASTDPSGELAAFAAGYAEAVATANRIDDYQRTFLATGFTDAEKPLDTIVGARHV
jgi:hypothetical protein